MLFKTNREYVLKNNMYLLNFAMVKIFIKFTLKIFYDGNLIYISFSLIFSPRLNKISIELWKSLKSLHVSNIFCNGNKISRSQRLSKFVKRDDHI